MKLIESKAEYIPQGEGLEGIYKQIELAGRTAYKSEDKITPDSAKGFVDRMIKSNHGACLEHGTVYLAIPYTEENVLAHYRGYAGKYNEIQFEKYSKVTMMRGAHNYVSTNFRVLQENGWLEDLQYLCAPTEYHEKRYTMKFTCSRAIAQELTRHRKFSFLMESQRYINYSKKKNGGEITFIKPSWLDIPVGIVYWHDGICWRIQQDENNPMEWFSVKPNNYFSEKEAQKTSTYFDALSYAEKRYFYLLKEGCQPQQARAVLPNATKTELIMTGFSSDWRFLLDLRLFEKTGKVDPDMLDLMQKAQKTMQEAGIWENIMSKESKFK